MTARTATPAPAAVPGVRLEPHPWLFSPRGIAVRLFLTAWLIYVLHFASNTVREVYLALAIGDHLSFRVDDYAGMHSDLFEKPGYGWHIGNNPGAPMVAAIPYALMRPLLDPIVERVNRRRAARGSQEPPAYDSPWPMAREFYREAWRRGLDIKFGLASLVMQALCMAPLAALGAVALFWVLRTTFGSDRTAMWLALLYAFGTPVFFRAGFLNQNLMLGHIAFAGFLLLWNPGGLCDWSSRARYLLAGLAGGAAVLFDYSGLLLLLGLWAYGMAKAFTLPSWQRQLFRKSCWYASGALLPILLLWFYQWRSFGHPFYPGQHWMPPVEWIERGYQGYGGPQWELFAALGFDYRFGFFTSCLLMLLALAAPLLDRGPRRRLPALETAALLGVFLAFWLFFSGSNYTRLQFNTGVRYMSPMYIFLFIPAVVVLMRLPRVWVYLTALLSVTQAWCLAMYRDVERGLGVLEPVVRVFSEGFQLRALTVLARMGGEYGEYFRGGVSPLPLFTLTAALLYALWSPRFRRAA